MIIIKLKSQYATELYLIRMLMTKYQNIFGQKVIISQKDHDSKTNLGFFLIRFHNLNVLHGETPKVTELFRHGHASTKYLQMF